MSTESLMSCILQVWRITAVKILEVPGFEDLY